MSSTVIDPKTKTPVVEGTEANGAGMPNPEAWPVPKFHEGLGDHPLWQALLDGIEANRQADIAEANRLADLELEK